MNYAVTVRFRDGTERRGRLTTAHAASSYGLPVVVVDGQPYGGGEVEVVVGSPEANAEARRAGYVAPR